MDIKKMKLLCLLFLASIICSCSKSVEEGMIIFTETPSQNNIDEIAQEGERIIGARLMAFDPDKKKKPVNLTKDFISASSPQISYNGEYLLFSAKKDAETPWQIWEMKLSNLKIRQVTSFSEDCVSPAYLPEGRFIFSRLLTNNTVKRSYVLFNGNLDGTNFTQITFSPQSFTANYVLKEGRVLSLVKQIYPTEKRSKLMVLRPDGTKIEFLYKSEKDFGPIRKVKESTNGQILFVETNIRDSKSEIVALDYNNPSKGRKVILSEGKEEFGFVSPINQNQWLTSKTTENKGSVLFELDSETKVLTELIKSENRIIDAVLVESYKRPRNLPSDVNPDSKTGLLMCQDVNYLGLKSIEGEEQKLKATKVEIIGVEKSLGMVDVEEDGSFYIKIDADVPFRLQTVSAEGEVVNGPGSWYFIRPNERRACVGCHTGPNVSPFNRQPLSIRKEPVIIHN